MKFVLFVEGHTERKALPEFLKRWLDARLPQRVGIKVVRFEGWRDYREEIAKKVELNLGGRAGADVIAGIGLLDLYGPKFYPAAAWHRYRSTPSASSRSRNSSRRARGGGWASRKDWRVWTSS